MSKRLQGAALVVCAATCALVLLGAGHAESTSQHHSARATVGAASVKVQTDTMKFKFCNGWIFENQGADNIYLNLNNESDAAVAASYTDQVVIVPGGVYTYEDHQLSQFKHISDTASLLYWQCTCYQS